MKLLHLAAGIASLGLGVLAGPAQAQGNGQGNGKLIAIITASLNNPFFVQMANAAETEAKKLGY